MSDNKALKRTQNYDANQGKQSTEPILSSASKTLWEGTTCSVYGRQCPVTTNVVLITIFMWHTIDECEKFISQSSLSYTYEKNKNCTIKNAIQQH